MTGQEWRLSRNEQYLESTVREASYFGVEISVVVWGGFFLSLSGHTTALHEFENGNVNP